MKFLKTDVLIIGAGGAGMYASIAAAQSGKNILLADKSLISRGGATVMAQMTVAAAVGHEEPDHWTHHLDDTIKSGQGLCNEELSSKIYQSGQHLIKDLIGKLIGHLKIIECHRLWLQDTALNVVVMLIFLIQALQYLELCVEKLLNTLILNVQAALTL